MTATRNRRLKKSANGWVKDVAREPAVNHVRNLRAAGMSNTEIAAAAKCSKETIRKLIRPGAEELLIDGSLCRDILAVRPPQRADLPRPGWSEHAACKGDPGPWVVEISRMTRWRHSKDAPTVDRYARQRAVCADCPVRQDCLAEAVDYEVRRRKGLHSWQIDVSIRGGMTPDEVLRHVDKLEGVR